MTKKKASKHVEDQNLKSAMGQIRKKYGEGSIMKLGSESHVKVATIPTGALNLDAATGIGGIPYGRITEIYGNEASGKTTLALHIAAEAQKKEGVIAFIDAEHALDPIYARKLGINTDELLISQPDSGEQALEIVETLVRSNAVDLIVVDSVAALVPQTEIEGEMGATHVGLQARLMSQALRKLTGIISKSNCALIFINQTRMKIGVAPYMNPRTTSGGVALKFYTSLRIELRKGPNIKTSPSNDIIGSAIWVKIVKNKLAPPFKRTQFDIIYGEGISSEGVLVDEGVNHKIISKKGSWFSYDGIQLGQGKEQTISFLNENPKMKKEIEEKVRVALGLTKSENRMKISKIKKIYKRNKHRVYIDHNFAFSLSKKALKKFNLSVGMEIPSEKLSSLQEKIELFEAEEALLYFLKYRIRSKQEIEKKLKFKKFSAQTIEKLIRKYERFGYINDENFAEIYLRDLIRNHPQGKFLLKRKLYEKGIIKDIIDPLFESNVTREVEQDMADRLTKKKARSLGRYEIKKQKQKALAYLQRKGFPYSVAKKSVSKFIGSEICAD